MYLWRKSQVKLRKHKTTCYLGTLILEQWVPYLWKKTKWHNNVNFPTAPTGKLKSNIDSTNHQVLNPITSLWRKKKKSSLKFLTNAIKLGEQFSIREYLGWAPPLALLSIILSSYRLVNNLFGGNFKSCTCMFFVRSHLCNKHIDMRNQSHYR